MENSEDKEKESTESEKKDNKKTGCNIEEILAVLCHELGHWYYSHTLKLIAINQVQIISQCCSVIITHSNWSQFLLQKCKCSYIQCAVLYGTCVYSYMHAVLVTSWTFLGKYFPLICPVWLLSQPARHVREFWFLQSPSHYWSHHCIRNDILAL